MASQLERLRAENLRLQQENERLRTRELELTALVKGAVKTLKALCSLAENWAYGPVFKKAGVHWPDGKCNAPSFLEAKRWLKNYNDNYDD